MGWEPTDPQSGPGGSRLSWSGPATERVRGRGDEGVAVCLVQHLRRYADAASTDGAGRFNTLCQVTRSVVNGGDATLPNATKPARPKGGWEMRNP